MTKPSHTEFLLKQALHRVKRLETERGELMHRIHILELRLEAAWDIITDREEKDD